MTAIVTGANRGIGLGLVRHLATRGDQVIAAARDPGAARELTALAAASPGRIRVVACDVTDEAGLRALADAVGDDDVHLLINNAGVYGGDEQTIDALDVAGAIRTFEVNALGPLRVTLALLPALRRGRAKVVHVTSGMGSIGDNNGGGYYAYRMSKAALNMAARSLAIDLRRDRVISVVINPGWVKTAMGGLGASITVDDSVTGMLRQIDLLTLADSGTFRTWRGGEYPW